MRDIDNTIASRLVIQLRDDNQRLKAANDCLHAGIQEYGRMVTRLQDKIRSLQQEVDRLSGVPQWERDRDCYDINAEYSPDA